MSTREVVSPPDRHALYEAHGYSPAVKAGELLFVSGQVGSSADGLPVEGYEAQVRQAFANLEAVLKAGGCSLDDVIDITSFHTDPEAQFESFMRMKSEKFGTVPFPTWTAVGVNWLAGFDFEIKVIARIAK